VAEVRYGGVASIAEKVSPLAATQGTLAAEEAKLKVIQGEIDELSSYLRERTYWPEVLAEVRRVLKSAEGVSSQKLGVPVGIWVDTFYSTEPVNPVVADTVTEDAPKYVSMSKELMIRYGLLKAPAGGASSSDESGDGSTAKPAKSKSTSTNEVAVLTLNIRAVNLQKVKQEANGQLAYDLEKEAKSSPLFDASETQLSGNLEQVEDSAITFTFPLKIKLKRPIKL
jgi:hypothetical protein